MDARADRAMGGVLVVLPLDDGLLGCAHERKALARVEPPRGVSEDAPRSTSTSTLLTAVRQSSLAVRPRSESPSDDSEASGELFAGALALPFSSSGGKWSVTSCAQRHESADCERAWWRAGRGDGRTFSSRLASLPSSSFLASLHLCRCARNTSLRSRLTPCGWKPAWYGILRATVPPAPPAPPAAPCCCAW